MTWTSRDFSFDKNGDMKKEGDCSFPDKTVKGWMRSFGPDTNGPWRVIIWQPDLIVMFMANSYARGIEAPCEKVRFAFVTRDK